ncbi:hypothetical protein NQ317_012904 [Molorchus minor]|uniref:Uncharacterized protein n=1 Tax=Molorchus minor TaxID=1323400 RepID=A0ABQ9JR81_9CUCU|nr:hypothetical protein NQ317_012904 [Molorchus minor]
MEIRLSVIKAVFLRRFERHISTARGRYKCTESIYVLHIPVLYTEHFVKLVRKAYIDRFERHISTDDTRGEGEKSIECARKEPVFPRGDALKEASDAESV